MAKETLPLNSLIDWLEFRAAKSTHPDPACGIWAIAVRSAMRELSDRAGVASLVAGEDTKRLDWLETQKESYGFADVHEGNDWLVEGPYRTAREAIDAARASAAAEPKGRT